MRDYYPIAKLERDGFEVIVDRTDEDISLRDHFDDSCHDITEMVRKVRVGLMEWFILRVRVMLAGHVLGTATVGGCLYDWNKVEDVMTDGVADEGIDFALAEAKAEVKRLKELMTAVDV